MIFEMRNTIIVSRDRGGVRGGLEGAKRQRRQEEENTYEVGVCWCDRISELPKSFKVEVYLYI